MSAVEETTAAAEEIADLPPSCKLVGYVLAQEGALTSEELREETLLPSRTVLEACNRLTDNGLIVERPSVSADARTTEYRLADSLEPWGGDER